MCPLSNPGRLARSSEKHLRQDLETVDIFRVVLYLFYRGSRANMPMCVALVCFICSPLMVRRFFEEREDQSEVKARIVSKYFYVWAKIIAPRAKVQRIGCIDLFAGPGRYKDGSASTPLILNP